ncbi:sugar ABC transporter substrate-binding protein [Paenibacillus sp. LHD-38]|uniref:ABC transporter substrate-binding protein n=1 Tax=Paenibacillus sp. LHD-38 TaxID=3072143 RepID=UPI00280CBBC8|nr:sugar ABC transporter substrate-binding protein [Paenibacillus sp. LHD-38]MDQ8736347.1 sugar ABC transporter substrate-binding protein [Paenibacillus sp. LHD-38]
MSQRRGRMIVLLVMLCLVLIVTACSSNSGNSGNSGNAGNDEPVNDSGSEDKPSGEKVKLKFMYWGSAFEKEAMEKMIKAFNSSHPNIEVKGEHVPGDYNAKINTLMATGDLPDVAYLGEGLALKWAADGKVLDMTQYLDQYPELNNRLKQSYYYYAPGKTIGTNTAAEMITMYYNKDLFEEAGIELPPTNGDSAWTWDQFVDVAKKLTKDSSGKTPNDPGFDPKNIVQYGISFPTWFGGWYPLLLSNEADITNADGSKFTMNSPEAIEVFTKLQDLMYKDFVAPTATQQQNMPATNVKLQTKKVAMAIDGQWALLDFAASKMNVGMGVLPKFKEPKTIVLGAPTVVFANTKHPNEALEFYIYHNNPEQVDLFSRGLWMPLEEAYYNEPAKIDSWIKNDAHPAEYKEAVIDYTLNFAGRSPSYSLKNFVEIEPKINAALDKIWTNKDPAEKVLKDMEKEVQPLLQGKYDAE